MDLSRFREFQEAFLSVFPQGESFDDPNYVEEERSYKQELCALFSSELAEQLADLPTERKEILSLADQAIGLFQRPLESTGRKPQNLVGFRYWNFLKHLSEDSKIEFIQELTNLLYGPGNLEARIDRMAEILRHLPAHPDWKYTPAAGRAIYSFFLFISDPENQFFIHTTMVSRALEDLTGKKLIKNFDGAGYRQVLDLAEEVRQQLETDGWSPRDMIDVHSFLWVRHGYENASRSGSSSDFSADDAERYLTERYGQRAEPTKYIAAYSTESGREIALQRDRKTVVQLFVDAAPSEPLPGVDLTDCYPRDRGRNSNLKSQAPSLATGKQAFLLKVDSRNALERFCNWYEGNLYSTNAEPAHQVGEAKVTSGKMELITPVNRILYGPPGTGKTYHTVNHAVSLIDPEFYSNHEGDRAALLRRFNKLREQGSIGFVTFHQSFSYEDFIEGLKAKAVDGQVAYEVEDGIFKRMCMLEETNIEKESAQSVDISGRNIWKMSLGNTLGDDAYVYDHCIEKNEVRLGYGREIDFSGCETRQQVEELYHKEISNSDDVSYGVGAVFRFKNRMAIGDLIVVSDGNTKFRAIGEIVGEYEHSPIDELGHFAQSRKVIWHRVWEKSLPSERLLKKIFSQQTLYKLKPTTIDLDKLQALLQTSAPSFKTDRLRPGTLLDGGRYVVEHASDEIIRVRAKRTNSVVSFDRQLVDELLHYAKAGKITVQDIAEKKVFDKTGSELEKFIVNGYPKLLAMLVDTLYSETDAGETEAEVSQARVLIIDEINRGNISSIFGDLITLIEPSKRAGQPEALSVVLPYSKEDFSVPSNLHIVGTMNTADRSLALLDTALRRRFDFFEMMPKPELLEGLVIEGINVRAMLEAMNRRINALYDREHTLGHAFFMPLWDIESEQEQLNTLHDIFHNKLLPLLEEYFFEDWEKIRAVLNDGNKPVDYQFIQISGESDDSLLSDQDFQFDFTEESSRIYTRVTSVLPAEAYQAIYE